MDTAVAAMAFVQNCDALVFDLRRNGGGSPGMVNFLSSHFFAEPTHLNSLWFRESDSTQDFWSLPGVPGVQRPEVPIVVLTSGDTFSGAEEFAYSLQALGRATLVGARTRGGAHPGRHIALGGPFGVFMPTGKAINPVTGTNWEGRGVIPDVEVPAEQALERALTDLRPLAARFGAARLDRRLSEWGEAGEIDATVRDGEAPVRKNAPRDPEPDRVP